MTQATARCFSGMQPTGSIHLGNYLGAVDSWVKLQEQYETFICIVDYHALTIPYEPKEMPGRVYDLALTFLACGIDPARTTLFVQSQVPAHTELCWLLNTVTPMGDLGRMTQFKEKSDQHKQNVNVGLFGYPVLQAADIALYHASVVPVGEDQVQHLEFAREIVRKWNARYGEYLVEPKPVLSRTPRVLGLDGKAKMSKSLGNHIGLLDTDEEIDKKLRGAFTDPAKLRRNDPGHPEVCNIFTLHGALTPAAQVQEIDRDCRSGALGCGDCKKMLGKSLSERLTPIRDKYASLASDPAATLSVLEAGGKRCREIAATTMAEVRSRMGLRIEAP